MERREPHEKHKSSAFLRQCSAAGAALGAVGTMAMAQNQRQVKRTARKLAKGAERAMSQLDTMVTDLVERRMDL